jgi:hypothetical protein
MSLIRKAGTVVLAVSFLTCGATLLMAHDNSGRCGEKVRKAEEKLRRDEQKHGYHSRQVERDRRTLEEARAKCDHFRH